MYEMRGSFYPLLNKRQSKVTANYCQVEMVKTNENSHNQKEYGRRLSPT